MLDAIVVGVGAMGAATCWQLARRGARVLGLDRDAIPNPRGSSGGESRLFRLAYYEHPDYVPLLVRAHALWREIERESEASLLHATGGLYLGREDEPFVAASRAAAERHGLAHDLLDRREILDRFPQLAPRDDHVALYEADAGVLLAEPSIAAFAAAARRHGAELRANEAVLEWSADASGVRVTTARATHRAAHLVVTAGAWTSRLVHDFGVPLVVTRQVMGWVRPPHPERFAIGAFPAWAVQNDDGSLHYGMPVLPGGTTLKVAHHHRGATADPDGVDRAPHAADADDFLPAFRALLPGAGDVLADIHVCLYTNSPDGHFAIDRHPAHPRVTVACGFSGHGFKFAPVIGEALADIALHGRTGLPVGFLSRARLGGASGLHPRR